jgi:hypothetical protein
MLSRIAKLFLVATSLGPIFITLWFIEFMKKWNDDNALIGNLAANWHCGLLYILFSILLILICIRLIMLSKRKLEKLPVQITSVKTVDKEIVGFILVYLLPLANQAPAKVNGTVLGFVAIFFFFIILTSHSYHFNPLLGFFGYHFYEVKISGEITFVLITKKGIANCKDITNVVQLTEYMILEA